MKDWVKILLGVLVLIIGIFVWMFPRENQRNHVSELRTESDCVDDLRPVFTHFPTDLANIMLISPPIMQVDSGVKSHSYIETTGPSPVYAPVDSTLITGAKYSEDYVDASKVQYTLFFDVGCGVSYYYDHLINASDKIAKEFPDGPQEHTRSSDLFSVEVKAGEIVGYSWAHQFDFGVLDSTTEPALAEFREYKNSEKAYAVCPMKFYSEELRQKLLNKVGYYDASDLVVIDNLCD